MASIFEKTPVNKDYNSPTPGEITLMAGYPNAPGACVNEDLCGQLKECGFNALSASIGVSNIDESLANCESKGLSLFLNNATMRQCLYTDNFVRLYNKDGLGGWFLNMVIPDHNILDPNEVYPNPEDPNYCPFYKNYEQIYAADPVHPIFLGINADWERDVNYTRPSENFPTILAKFQEKFQPSFWPWIYFPDLTTDGEVTIPERWANFYKNLQYFAYVARYTAVPFWAFCRCQGFSNSYGYNAPDPTLQSIRKTVFSILAFGGQGIYYWNYRKSVNEEDAKAPVDKKGQKTKVWDYVQAVNQEVKAFNDIFCGCELIDARFKSSSDKMKDLKKMTNPIGPLMDISGTNPEVLVSHIYSGGRDYLIVVSTSDTIQNLTLRFSDYWNLQQITMSSDKSKLDYNEIETQYPTNLSVGDYLIFTWK